MREPIFVKKMNLFLATKPSSEKEYQLKVNASLGFFDIVENLLKKSIKKISNKALEEALEFAALSNKGTSETAQLYTVSAILQLSGPRIPVSKLDNVFNRLIEKQKFQLANILFEFNPDKKNLDNLEGITSSTMLYNKARYGQISNLDDFFSKNDFSSNQIMNAYRYAKFNKNDSILPALVSQIKQKVDQKDIEMNEILKNGDLFYGISDSRNDFLFDNEINLRVPTVDSINNELIESKSLSKYGKYRGLNFAKTEDAKSHFEFLESHSKYNPNIVKGDLVSRRNTRIKRSCKGGIERIIRGTTGNKIYFILEGFDPIRALNKTEPISRSFTSSEFRKIYREYIINPEMTDKNIVFVTGDDKFIKPSQYFKSLEGKHDYNPKSLLNIRDKAPINELQSDSNDEFTKKDVLIEKMEKMLSKSKHREQNKTKSPKDSKNMDIR